MFSPESHHLCLERYSRFCTGRILKICEGKGKVPKLVLDTEIKRVFRKPRTKAVK